MEKETQFIQKESKEGYSHNLLTNFEETIQKMAEVEGLNSEVSGQGWLKRETAEDAGEESIAAAMKHLKEGDYEEEDARDIFTKILGDGNVNRWGVRRNGDIAFSRFHAGKEFLEKAEELGFEIF